MTNNKDLNYIAECAESVGIHVDEHTAISIPFIADVMRKMREQEPCEDCISRKQAMKACYQMAVRTGIEEMPYKYAETELAHLPSIQPKTDVLDKIRAEIEQVKYIMNEEIINHDRKDLINFVNGLNQSLAIIDKYKAEKELETWEGIHEQVTAPKGTFDKIWNEAEEDNDEV